MAWLTLCAQRDGSAHNLLWACHADLSHHLTGPNLFPSQLRSRPIAARREGSRGVGYGRGPFRASTRQCGVRHGDVSARAAAGPGEW